MLEVNLSDVVAEVRGCFDRYEKALVDNDVEVLDELFWGSPLTVRYGVAESQYGFATISAWRRNSGPFAERRALSNTTITSFGRDFAIANTEFRWEGSDRVGRQSQTWVRLPEGWRIVSASVSFLSEPAQ